MVRSKPRRHFGWKVLAATCALSICAGASVAWAVTTVLTPTEDPYDDIDYTVVTAAQGEVASSLALNAIASWTSTPAGRNRAAGVITSVGVSSGDEVTPGTTLYSVNLRPVIAAVGDVPAFRAIEADTEGPDVRQLQAMLATLGFFTRDADGIAGSATIKAIQRWQKSLGLDETGRVEEGDVIYLPALPARINLNSEQISLGSSLAGGEQVVGVLSDAPTFTLSTTELQANQIAIGARVELSSPDGTAWGASVGSRSYDSTTQTVLFKLEASGGTICGDKCGQIPVAGGSELKSKVITAEPVAGVVIPSAALGTDASGGTSVVSESGKRLAVGVVASANGMSVITGVQDGVRVRISATGKE